MNKEFIIHYFFYFIFIEFSLIIISRQEIIEYNIEFPIVLTLLNNRNAVVSRDGIHFYDESLTNENEKNITFETPIDQNNIDGISMAQFKEINWEYILILVNKIIYIFKSDETYLNRFDLSPQINGEHYCLIPYKKYDNEFLDYFILFVNDKNIYIKHFRLDLNITKNEIKNDLCFKSFNYKGEDANHITGINCIFMAPISFDINHDLLTCFYSVNYPPSIVSSLYDQEDNFTEVARFYQNYSAFEYYCSYVNGVTNEDKAKALIYITQGTYPYSCTFDFINGFSPIISESENGLYLIREAFHLQKMIYNTINHEFIVFTSRELQNDCQIYILIYDNNYKIKKKGILFFNSTYCSYIINYSLIKTGNSYSVLVHGNEFSVSAVARFIDEMKIVNISQIDTTTDKDFFTELNTKINKDTFLVETNIISDSNEMTNNIISTETTSLESNILTNIQTINIPFTEGNIITDTSTINFDENHITDIPSVYNSESEEKVVTDIPTTLSSTIKEITTTDIASINTPITEENIIIDISTIKEITTTTIEDVETSFIDRSSDLIPNTLNLIIILQIE